MSEKILLDHGSGGAMMQDLIGDVFKSKFDNKYLNSGDDSAILPNDLVFSTDAFVISPHFFPGGDIGKLAICGTVNDLAVSGAKPLYLSTTFIIEEGFEFSNLEKIVDSMSKTAKEAGVEIVTGDTKVVKKGDADGIFITTSGVGKLIYDVSEKNIEVGNKIIISGTLAEHGFAVLSKREGIDLESEILTDCAPLNGMIEELMNKVEAVKFMRDPTRGGIAAVLNEIVNSKRFGIEIDEKNIPLSNSVRAVSELLGIDPWQVASEGRAVIIVDEKSVDGAIKILNKNKYGKDACVIGEVVSENIGKVVAKMPGGGKRVVPMPAGEGLPRIC